MVKRNGRNAGGGWNRGGQGILAVAASMIALGVVTLSFNVSTAEPISGRENVQPVTARELLGTKGMSGLRVSPDGKLAVVRVDSKDLAKNAWDLNWYVVRLADGHVTWIGNAGDPIWSTNGALDTVAPQWSQDGQWIYYRGIRNQQAQVWRVKVDGSEQEAVTALDADVQGFIINADGSLLVAVDPATRAEIQAAEKAQYDNGVLMDQTIITGFPLIDSFPVNGRMATLRTNLPNMSRNFGRGTLLGNQPLKVFRRDAKASEFTQASAQEAERFAGWWDRGGFDPFDPQHGGGKEATQGSKSATLEALVGEARKQLPPSRSRTYLRVADATQTNVVCTDAKCIDADGLSIAGWSVDGSELIVQTTDELTETLRAWNVKKGSLRTIFDPGAMLGSHLSGTSGPCQLVGKSKADQSAVCLTSGPETPPRMILVNLTSGTSRSLFDPNPNLTSDRLGRVEKISLKDRWGGIATGFLVLPRAWLAMRPDQRPRLPLVITSYTCTGFLKGGSGEDVPEHVLTGMGYAAVCGDFSGGTIRQGAGFNIDVDYGSFKQEHDFFEDAAKQLVARGIVDSKRVAISGFSGSSAGVSYTIHKSDKFAAAIVTTQSYTDPIECQLGGNADNCRRLMKMLGFNPPYDSSDGYYGPVSPGRNAPQITTPVLMQLAEVEYMGNMQFYSALKDIDRAVDMYVFADEYHSKHQPRHVLAVYDRNIAWIDFWLKGIEPVDRAGDELPRWREFRDKQCTLFKSGQGNMQEPWYCPTP